MKSEHITVDLEFKCRGKCPDLVKAFELNDEYVHVFQVSKVVTGFNLSLNSGKNPDMCISICCDFIFSLPEVPRNQWMKGHHKNFNIGYITGSGDWAYESGVTAKTTKKIADLGAAISITLYPREIYDKE